jgi:hypothetical protein
MANSLALAKGPGSVREPSCTASGARRESRDRHLDESDWTDVTDGAMAMLLYVVPMNESAGLSPALSSPAKPLAGDSDGIWRCEKDFRRRRCRHSHGARVRRLDAQPVHGNDLELGTVQQRLVFMEGSPFGQHRAPDQRDKVIQVAALVHFPAHDLAAVQVHDQTKLSATVTGKSCLRREQSCYRPVSKCLSISHYCLPLSLHPRFQVPLRQYSDPRGNITKVTNPAVFDSDGVTLVPNGSDESIAETEVTSTRVLDIFRIIKSARVTILMCE